MSANWHPPGYRSREEWLEDRHLAALDAMTWRNRLARWWWINWPSVVTTTALAAVAVGLFVWAVAR